MLQEGKNQRISLEFEERRSKILSGSDLNCLNDVSTINVTRGCAHGCVYCYGQGYSTYPGAGRVVLYRDLPQKLEAELARKRTKPLRVYFSPSCDAFQPLTEVQDATFEIMSILLARRISVAFLTKGKVGGRFLELFRKTPGLVFAQIGMTTLNDAVSERLESVAASPDDRLANLRQLAEAGVAVMARLDPLIPFLTDSSTNLSPLFKMIAERGVKTVAANYLFLRRSLTQKICAGLEPLGVSPEKLMPLYRSGPNLPMYRDRSLIRALPGDFRRMNYERITALAAKAGLAVHLCACKNSDISSSRCNLAGPPLPRPSDLFASNS